MSPGSGETKFKVRLASGRVLGPIDRARVRKLIEKNKITGIESARIHPSGEWMSINAIPEIADLLVAKAQGLLSKDKTAGAVSPPPMPGR